MVRWILLAGLLSLGAYSSGGKSVYQGYAEGEYVRVAAPFAGSLTALAVKRGDQVKAGAPLYALEQENERAARLEAEERLKKAGDSLEAVRAQRVQAAAQLKHAEQTYRRTQELAGKRFVSPQALDDARSSLDQARAGLASLDAQATAAAAEAEAAKAVLAQAKWKLDQKTVAAPVAGVVDDTLYVKGEWVPAGSPVVSLLPPQNIKARFFVPESRLGGLKPGQTVELRCDGCAAPIAATISFIASQAEYTPPVIYSKENRAKLVYLVEARPRPEDAVRLHPGQPLDVQL
ncbi:MAG: HlyD family secretion protein [Sulfuricellaceae bacterium]